MFGRITSFLACYLSRNERLLCRLRAEADRIEQRWSTLEGEQDLQRLLAQARRELAAERTASRASVFALVAESCRRVSGIRLRRVQLLAALALSDQFVVEMATGEGKTLAALPAACLAALEGGGVHVITANDYLAGRDADSAQAVLGPLGLRVGVIKNGMTRRARSQAYACDVTYLTNKEAAADYLRDQLRLDAAAQVQRGLIAAIVDEADSVLIDEARTPLLISGAPEEEDARPLMADRIAAALVQAIDFDADAKERRCALTERGLDRVAHAIEVDPVSEVGLEWLHLVERALTARHVYREGVEYLAEAGRVVLVDSFTGRKLPARRLRGGLHRALEIKEGLAERPEQGTLASISYQSFFRQYASLAGMSGTAAAAAGEFDSCYQREVLVIPRHLPCRRLDLPDRVFATAEARWQAVAAEVEAAQRSGRPVLVGTGSVADSEALASRLRTGGVEPEVLNARQDMREAEVVSRAGQVGAVTIATDMAGRGTDIRLAPGVAELGGLLVIGTARHDARRIDDQLRGRAGRQGDPGASRFLLSLDDSLLALHGATRIDRWRARLQAGAVDPDAAGLGAFVRQCQGVIEARHQSSRRDLREYDQIAEIQRTLVVDTRQQLVERRSVWENFDDWLEEETHSAEALARQRGTLLELRDRLGEERFLDLLRRAMLSAIDVFWSRHVGRVERLRGSMRYEGRSGKDPLTLYRRRCFQLFDEMLAETRQVAVARVLEQPVAGP